MGARVLLLQLLASRGKDGEVTCGDGVALPTHWRQVRSASCDSTVCELNLLRPLLSVLSSGRKTEIQVIT